jgi:hypothetical protein
MKKISIITILMMSTLLSLAQYKKAGGLYGREGVSRTYGIGVNVSALTYYPAPAIGFVLAGGAEREESKWFSNSSLRITLPINFALKTVAKNNNSGTTYNVTLKAKTTISAGADYEFGRYFGDIDNREKKLIPYVAGGIGFMVGKFKEGSDNRQDILNQTGADVVYGQLEEDGISAGGSISAGLGAIYFLNEKVGIRAQASYHYNVNFENALLGNEDEYKIYTPFNSGLVFQVRLHFKLPY